MKRLIGSLIIVVFMAVGCGSSYNFNREEPYLTIDELNIFSSDNLERTMNQAANIVQGNVQEGKYHNAIATVAWLQGVTQDSADCAPDGLTRQDLLEKATYYDKLMNEIIGYCGDKRGAAVSHKDTARDYYVKSHLRGIGFGIEYREKLGLSEPKDAQEAIQAFIKTAKDAKKS